MRNSVYKNLSGIFFIAFTAIGLSACDGRPGSPGVQRVTDLQSITISGSIDEDGEVSLRSIYAHPQAPRSNREGPYQAAVRSVEGNLQSFRFDVEQESKGGAARFSISVPFQQLSEIRILHQRQQIGRFVQEERPELTERRLHEIEIEEAGGQVCVEWPDHVYPYATLMLYSEQGGYQTVFAEATSGERCAAMPDSDADQWRLTLRNNLAIEQLSIRRR